MVCTAREGDGTGFSRSAPREKRRMELEKSGLAGENLESGGFFLFRMAFFRVWWRVFGCFLVSVAFFFHLFLVWGFFSFVGWRFLQGKREKERGGRERDGARKPRTDGTEGVGATRKENGGVEKRGNEKPFSGFWFLFFSLLLFFFCGGLARDGMAFFSFFSVGLAKKKGKEKKFFRRFGFGKTKKRWQEKKKAGARGRGVGVLFLLFSFSLFFCLSRFLLFSCLSSFSDYVSFLVFLVFLIFFSAE